jgi:hypothetical protein
LQFFSRCLILHPAYDKTGYFARAGIAAAAEHPVLFKITGTMSHLKLRFATFEVWGSLLRKAGFRLAPPP